MTTQQTLQTPTGPVERTAVRPTETGAAVTDAVGSTSSGVRLRLIPGFELVADKAPVDLALGSQRLLVLLALHDRPVGRNFAAFTLWTDKSEERALANLRATLWRLRRPGLGLVEASTNQLRLGNEVAVDYRDSLRRAQAILTGNAVPSTEEIGSLLVEGNLLADWYEDWISAPRERIRQLRLHALEVVCTRLTAVGRLPEAIDIALAAVAAEPLRESAHRVLIEAYITEGNHAEALRQYEIYRYRVHRDVGILPSEHIERLVAAVRNPALRTKGGRS